MNNLKQHKGVHARILSTHTHGHTLTHLRRVPLDLEAKQASVHAFVGEGPTYGCAFPSSSTCRPPTAVSGSHKGMPSHAHPPAAPHLKLRFAIHAGDGHGKAFAPMVVVGLVPQRVGVQESRLATAKKAPRTQRHTHHSQHSHSHRHRHR